VKDRDREPFISWERLYVNGRIVPILKRELDLDRLELIRLQAHVHLLCDGSLNFSDLLDSSGTAEPTHPRPRQLVDF
jgi:hypothetical protein